MSTDKHTPGPWNAVGVGYVHSNGCPSICSAIGGRDGDEARANAQLIAAAPDLLEALERMVWAAGHEGWGTGPGMYHQEIKAARAAIAKARGEEA